jgi:hypothetical protein
MIIREATRTGGGYRYRIEVPGMYVDADGHPLPGERFVDVSEAAVLGANGDPDALAAAILAALDADYIAPVRDVNLAAWRYERAKGVARPIAAGKVARERPVAKFRDLPK